MTTQKHAPIYSDTPAAPAVPQVSAPDVATRVAQFVRKVGKGRTLLKSLDRIEAADAFDLLLDGAFADSQAGAFLQALRIKELSPDELEGLMDALTSRQPAAVPRLPAGGFTLNLASDTPRKGGYASLLAASVLAREGFPVGVVRSEPVLSGNRASWDGTWDLVTGANASAPLRPSEETSPRTTDHADPACVEHGEDCEGTHPPAALCIVDSQDLVASLRNLRKIRGELGFRSCLHTAEKLLNPWPDKPLILGISHRHYADRLCDHFAQRNMTAKILLGNHGTTDLVLHKETEVWEVLPGGEIRTVWFHPDDVGLVPDSGVYSLGAFPDWAREWRLPGHGVLGPVLDYHLAFLRYAAGGPVASSLTKVPQATPVTGNPRKTSGHIVPRLMQVQD